MNDSLRQRILSLLLIPAGLIALLGLAELFFRYIVPAPDIPQPAYSGGVLRHQPDQRGVYWSGDVEAPFHINAQGWNSVRPDYSPVRTAAPRIAVIGDALVEALQVPPDKSIAEDLERELPGVEVFRYGISGAPLSQFLQMARKDALPAHPDVLVVVVDHGDFDSSYREVPGTFAKSFLKLRLDAEDQVQELPPEPYVQGLASRLRNRSATWRYLAYGRQFRFAALRRIFLHQGQDRRYEADIDITDLAERESLDRRAARYLFSRLKAESTGAGAYLLLVMDGVRESIEAGRQASPDGAFRLNRLAADEAEKLGIHFLDLTTAFAADFNANRQPFSASDGRWNEHAHAVAAAATAAELRRLGWLHPAGRSRQ